MGQPVLPKRFFSRLHKPAEREICRHAIRPEFPQGREKSDLIHEPRLDQLGGKIGAAFDEEPVHSALAELRETIGKCDAPGRPRTGSG